MQMGGLRLGGGSLARARGEAPGCAGEVERASGWGLVPVTRSMQVRGSQLMRGKVQERAPPPPHRRGRAPAPGGG